MEQENGLVFACLLDGKGGGKTCGWNDVREWKEQDGCLWTHLDRSNPEVQRWVHEDAGLDSIAAEALLAEATRPRWVMFDQGLLVILRGVNLNPGADPEDMVSIRIWIEHHRVISMRLRR